MKPLATLLLATLAGTITAQAPTVTTVLSNGTTQSRYDMVILGDGYQAFEQAQFNADVTTFLAVLFQTQPYQTFAAYYNVHTVFRASVESGADRPDENPPVFKNTVYNSSYNIGGVDRCLYIQNTSQALADAALAPANEGRILVMVNDSRYGGCAGQFAVSYNGSQMSNVQVHELGHSLGQLADEYDYPNNTYTGSEPAAVNITTSPTGAKWSIWHGTDGISAFQGAGYYLFGLYRPKLNCMMRSLGVALCRVCQENTVKITNSIVDTIVTTTPANTAVTVSVPQLQTFSFTHIVPPGNAPLIRWRLDGNVLPGATTTSYTLNSTTVAPGLHTLEASVLDQTLLVRSDPQQVMRETHTWQVTVDDPTASQLRVTAMTSSSVWVPAGGAVTLTTTVRNDGPGAAGPFDVEWFLSPTSSWSAQSTYLGKVTLAGLAAAQQTVIPHAVNVPWGMAATPQYVFAVADRLDVVNESNEGDNVRSLAVIGQAPGCVTKIEFNDPLVYPYDATSMSRTTGGSVHPRLIAPCANPAATIYLMAWTGSGTQPGIPLAPGLVLPLNYDPLTQLSLDGLNGPVFGGFLGLLDAQGRAQATFTLPPLAGVPLGQTHFAALLLGNAQLFTAVSNPIGLQLLP
jgi:IgA Peptidase M64/CARDB